MDGEEGRWSLVGWLGRGREELQRKGRETLPGFLGCQDRGGSFLPSAAGMLMGKLELCPQIVLETLFLEIPSATYSRLRSSRRIKPIQFNPYIHKWYARPIPIPNPS